MSDDRKGGFGDKKKPRATFGDVMLGIPAGKGGEREGGRRDDRRDRPQRRDGGRGGEPRGPAHAEQPAGTEQPKQAESAGKGGHGRDRDRGGRRRDRERKPEQKEVRKPQGPLVVVKRATGAIETRPLDAPLAPSAAEEPAAAPEGSEGAAEVAQEAREPERQSPLVSPGGPGSVSEDVAEQESFAELYEASAKQGGGPSRKSYRVGEKVSGKIFQLGADTAFVSLGGKSEAMIELRELKDEEGILRFGIGDAVDAFVVESGARGIFLSKNVGKSAASMAMLAEARVSGMPVEGLVLSAKKAGLEVAVGEARAFCPASQIDVRFVENIEQFVGEKLLFRVLEVRDRNVVLSRRSLLEEEQKAKAAETRKELAEGKVMRGKVTGVRDFGAFVDLGGIEGMIPASELSYQRVKHPSEVVKVGDDVEVEVLRLEAAQPNSPDKAKQKERITLSMRSRQEDPWKTFLADAKEGARFTGKVVRLQPFGAFVELRPGVDGLIHVSALSDRRIAHPKDVVSVGQEVSVVVEKIEPTDRKVGLRLVTETGEVVGGTVAEEGAAASTPGPKREHAPRPRAGDVVTGKVDRVENYGVFLAFPGGKGLIPGAETGTERGTDLRKHFHLGQELKATVLEVDASGKIRLSLTAAERAEERAALESWKQTQKKPGGKGFGTFADLLKDKKLL